jgi:hypothetical protein
VSTWRCSARPGQVDENRLALWNWDGGNCFYGFTSTRGIAGISLYVPLSTAPEFYPITAEIADIDWQAKPWRLVSVVFTYQVVAPATVPPGGSPSTGAASADLVPGDSAAPGCGGADGRGVSYPGRELPGRRIYPPFRFRGSGVS